MIQHDFIYGNIINHDICDRLIDLFEETSDGDTPISLTNGWEGNMIKERGVVGRMKKEVSDGESLSTIDETRKMSTDLSVPHYADHPTVSQYNQELSINTALFFLGFLVVVKNGAMLHGMLLIFKNTNLTKRSLLGIRNEQPCVRVLFVDI